jgi:hypothetical protein
MKKTKPARARSSDENARLAVNLPIATHRALKARAAAKGVTIRAFLLALLRDAGLS